MLSRGGPAAPLESHPGFNLRMSQEPFGDIPLFREIQKLLSSSTGPINFEIARQVAMAVALEGGTEPAPDRAGTAAFAQAVRSGEVVLAGYTRLPFEEPVATEVITVATWVTSTLDAWSWILERLALRFTGELARLSGESSEDNPMQAVLGQIGPLLVGMQVGTLVGHLATEALARYDLPLPRDDDQHLFVVGLNVARVARDYGVESSDLLAWLALHEVARHLVMTSVPWVQRYVRSLLTEVVDAIEIDVSGLESRFMDLQSQGMDALQRGVAPDSLLPIVPTQRHERSLERLRSFLALFEGYCTHASVAVAGEIAHGGPRVEEGMARRRASPSEGETMLSSILGISVDRALETSGATFCAAVVKLKGPLALNHVWDAPDNLPTPEEIRDPFAWMERQGL